MYMSVKHIYQLNTGYIESQFYLLKFMLWFQVNTMEPLSMIPTQHYKARNNVLIIWPAEHH